MIHSAITIFSLGAALVLLGSPRSFGQESENGAGQVEKGNRGEADPTLLPHQHRFDRAFSMIKNQKRKLDPFGTPMSEEEARKQPIVPEEPELTEPEVAEDLLDAALKKLTITGIMPRTGTVLIGGRSLKVGQTLAIRHQEVLFRLRLSKVNGNGLEFADLDSARIATLPLNIMPLGMMKKGALKRRLPTGAQRLSVEMLIQ